MSRLTRTLVRRAVVLTISPGQLGPGSKVPQVDELSRPTWTLVQKAVGSTRYSGRLRRGSEELCGAIALPANSVPGPSRHKVNHRSRPILSVFRADAVSLSCPGRHGPVSEELRG